MGTCIVGHCPEFTAIIEWLTYQITTETQCETDDVLDECKVNHGTDEIHDILIEAFISQDHQNNQELSDYLETIKSALLDDELLDLALSGTILHLLIDSRGYYMAELNTEL